MGGFRFRRVRHCSAPNRCSWCSDIDSYFSRASCIEVASSWICVKCSDLTNYSRSPADVPEAMEAHINQFIPCSSIHIVGLEVRCYRTKIDSLQWTGPRHYMQVILLARIETMSAIKFFFSRVQNLHYCNFTTQFQLLSMTIQDLWQKDRCPQPGTSI